MGAAFWILFIISFAQAQADVCKDVPADLPEILSITLNRTEMTVARVQLRTTFPLSGWRFELEHGRYGYIIPLGGNHNKAHPNSPFETEHTTQVDSVHTFSLLNRQTVNSLKFYDIYFRACFSICGKSCYDFEIEKSYPTLKFGQVKLVKAPKTNTVVDSNGKMETKTVVQTDSDQFEALDQDDVAVRYSEKMNHSEPAATYINRVETVQNSTNLISIQVHANLPDFISAIGRVEVFQLTHGPLPYITFEHFVEYRKPAVTLAPLLIIEPCSSINFYGITGTKSRFVGNVLKIETNVGKIQCLSIETSGEPETRIKVLRMDTVQEQVNEAQGTVFSKLEVYIDPLEEDEERMYMVTAENEHGSVTKLAVFSSLSSED